MPKSLREQLEESFDLDGEKVEDEEITSEQEEEEEPEESSEEVVSEKEVEEPEEEPEGEEEPEEEPEGEEEPEDTSSLKAPASWKPAIREHWKTLPPDVKKEVLRRETEIQKGLQQASGHRKVADEYIGIIRPFEQLIRSQNSTPSEAVTNMLTTAARLTMGTPQQKAQVVTEIIKNYAIDIEILDDVLSGAEIPDPAANPILAQIDQRLSPITSFMQEFQNYKNQDSSNLQTQITNDLNDFSSNPKNEFYDDVREDMADIMELGAKRGRTVTLEDAYKQACQLNPDIKKVVDQRDAAARNALTPEQKAKKKKASSSLASSSPTGVKAGKGELDLRSSIAAAFDEAEES